MSTASILKNRNFVGLLLANAIFGMAFPVQLLLGGLAGLMLAPAPSMATLPSAVQTFAGLLAAAPISLLMGRYGRRAGFTLGALLTLVGGVAAVQAIYAESFWLLCIAHFLMGAGWASFQFFRFAAGEVVVAGLRPISISLMLSALLVAALVGPQIFIAAKDILAPVPFAGAYAATGVIAVLGLLPLAAVRPAVQPSATQMRGTRWGMARLALWRPAVRRAIAIAALSQGVMVFLMIPTPIAMVGCGFSDEVASDVVRWHIVAMFAPSFLTGFLIKRFGMQVIASLGLALICVASGVAALGLSAPHFYGALILLGVGWNFAFIGATTMLDAALEEREKASVQGINDTVIALVSTICAFSAGWVLSGLGWAMLATLSGAIVVSALATLVLGRLRHPV